MEYEYNDEGIVEHLETFEKEVGEYPTFRIQNDHIGAVGYSANFVGWQFNEMKKLQAELDKLRKKNEELK